MRTALLSANRRTAEGDLRAGLMLAGRSIIAWQADWAAALGCERVICLCETPGEAVLALQREVEAKGGEFHALRNNIQLAGLVRAEDEVIILLDGFVPGRASVDSWRNAKGELVRGIATLPASHAEATDFPEDFERIDRDRLWGGIAVIKAAQLHKLADLPPDSDPVSLLLRLALQAQVPTWAMPADAFETQQIVFATSPSQLARRESALVGSAASSPDWRGPGSALAAALVRAITPDRINLIPQAGLASGAVLLTAASGLAFFGLPVAGLVMAGLGAFAISLAQAGSTLKSRLWSVQQGRFWGYPARVAVDLMMLMVLLIISGLSVAFDTTHPVETLVIPVLAVGLSHYLASRECSKLAPWWGDRAIHCLLFALAALFGQLPAAISFFALLALADLLLARKRI